MLKEHTEVLKRHIRFSDIITHFPFLGFLSPSAFRKIMAFFDLCIVGGAFFIGYPLIEKISNLYPLSSYITLLPILLLTWGGLLYYFGMYKSFRARKIPEILLIMLKTTLLGFILFSSYVFIFKVQYISRLFIIVTFIMATALISIEKVVLVYLLRYMYKIGVKFRSVLIVGTGKRAQHFINLINKNAEWGIKIVGLVDEDETKKGELIKNCKVIGSFKDIPEILHNIVVDEVVFIVPRSWLGKIENILYFCETQGVAVNIAADLFDLKFSKMKQTDLYGFPVLSFVCTPDRLWQLLIKRLFDLIFSGIALIILAPVFIITAIIIKATSKGPVFFKQERSGLNGRRFILYKFRTMVVDAETRLKDLLSSNEMNGPVFKMTRDPRITKIGKILRRFSIDELPQLWNVFKGDMSIVGPIPPIPEEVKNYDYWHRRKLSMRPGITCLWQVGGRSKITDFSEWMRLDLKYIDNWSLWLDCKILLKTIPTVLFGIGAK